MSDSKEIEVVATGRGYYGNLREIGDKFFIKSEEDFSDTWMAKPHAAKKPAAKKKKKEPEVLGDLSSKAVNKEGGPEVLGDLSKPGSPDFLDTKE